MRVTENSLLKTNKYVSSMWVMGAGKHVAILLPGRN